MGILDGSSLRPLMVYRHMILESLDDALRSNSPSLRYVSHLLTLSQEFMEHVGVYYPHEVGHEFILCAFFFDLCVLIISSSSFRASEPIQLHLQKMCARLWHHTQACTFMKSRLWICISQRKSARAPLLCLHRIVVQKRRGRRRLRPAPCNRGLAPKARSHRTCPWNGWPVLDGSRNASF